MTEDWSHWHTTPGPYQAVFAALYDPRPPAPRRLRAIAPALASARRVVWWYSSSTDAATQCTVTLVPWPGLGAPL